MSTPTSAQRNRNRTMLLAIFVIFFGSFFVAGILRFSGWRPEALKNRGELLQPPTDLRAITPRLANGDIYAWNPVERTWRIVVAPPAGCAQACVALSRELDTVWQLFGQKADHVHTLWLGEPPRGAVHNPSLKVIGDDPALRALLPRLGDGAGLPVYVVDPNGFVILRYAPGFDPGDLRTDLARLLKLR